MKTKWLDVCRRKVADRSSAQAMSMSAKGMLAVNIDVRPVQGCRAEDSWYTGHATTDADPVRVVNTPSGISRPTTSRLCWLNVQTNASPR